MPLILAPTRAALEAKLARMPQFTLAWAADALFAGTPEEAIAFYRALAGLGFQYPSPPAGRGRGDGRAAWRGGAAAFAR